MVTVRRTFRLAWCLLIAAHAAAPAWSTERTASVGEDGELYLIHEGSYGSLFPGLGLADPKNSVLAVDIVRPDQSVERLLVPGTDTLDVEDSASILFEERSGTLFVLWQTWVNVIHSRLSLTGYRGGEWIDPVEITGNPYGWKSAPQFTVTQDSYNLLDDDGALRSVARTVVHLVWSEEGADGPQPLYGPIVFLDGQYTGWNPVYRLDELVAVQGGSPLPPANLALAEAPKVETGSNAESIVLGFVHPSGELISINVETLPGEIGFVADKVRNQISDLGREYLPGRPAALAGKVRNQISDLGNRLGLHPGVTAYLGEQAYLEIANGGEMGPSALAEKVRNQISDLGARITDRGFGRLSDKSSMMLLELPGGPTSAPNQFRVLQSSARPVPSTGAKGILLHLSRSGSYLLVSWSDGDSVYFRESQGEGWSSPRRLRLATDLDLARAHEILARRADEHGDE